ncbi:2-amino-4-hydroxy-6-hydroxymethyldihydropteridine diphosphokinase [Thalassospira sp.]|uniref:2-amino-4-hydroxy-6- hydroxymethyldihydropteridine diphosphokinase n=1 Tax=Thalassospira sp. TaxID=1912094 RepID=UPI00352654B5
MQKYQPGLMNDPAAVILIAMGANLPTVQYGAPDATLRAALARLANGGDIVIADISPFYETAPVPVSDQPWYVNGVARIETHLPPAGVLARLHDVEAEFGRTRRERNEARVLDLDLIAYRQEVIATPGGMHVPHPRMADRAFVLLPLRDVAPDWIHPVSGRHIDDLIADLPGEQEIRCKP